MFWLITDIICGKVECGRASADCCSQSS